MKLRAETPIILACNQVTSLPAKEPHLIVTPPVNAHRPELHIASRAFRAYAFFQERLTYAASLLSSFSSKWSRQLCRNASRTCTYSEAMAPMPSSTRRPFNTRRRSARKSDSNLSSAESPSQTETRSMKRKYVPGGPGGGGRYVENDGTEVPVGGTGPGGYNYIGPRGRVGRENAANGVQPVEFPRPRRESRRERVPTRPRFSSAAAAAAAVVHGDGFKPREERSWEEFHQDLDIGALFPVFPSDEVDGIKKPTTTSSFDDRNGSPFRGEDGETPTNGDRHDRDSATPGAADSTPKRRPGRPPRRVDSMLKA